MSDTRIRYCRLCGTAVSQEADHADRTLCEPCFELSVKVAVAKFNEDNDE